MNFIVCSLVSHPRTDFGNCSRSGIDQTGFYFVAPVEYQFYLHFAVAVAYYCYTIKTLLTDVSSLLYFSIKLRSDCASIT